MNIYPRYRVGDILYVVIYWDDDDDQTYHAVRAEKIEKVIATKTSCVGIGYSTDHRRFYEEERINGRCCYSDDRIYVFDSRKQAYQAACKLIDSDIERQLDVIGVE